MINIFFFFLQNLPRESKIGRRWKISRIILYNRRYKQFREINLSEILLFFARFLSARQLSSTGRVTEARRGREIEAFDPFRGWQGRGGRCLQATVIQLGVSVTSAPAWKPINPATSAWPERRLSACNRNTWKISKAPGKCFGSLAKP